MVRLPMGVWKRLAAVGFVLCMASLAPAGQLTILPAELVRQTVQNETAVANNSPHHMFVSVRETAHGSQTKLYCETRDAMAGMAIAYDHQPLTAQQRAAEDSRLDDLISNPSELVKKRQREKEDAERTTRIVRAMPDAFLYEYDGTESGKPSLGKAGDELVRLRFRPNPKYEPPSRVEQVLQGMQGVLLIDANKRHIARIDGTLYKEVGFGWGILGHLDKGGHFLVEQADIGDDTWEIVHMSLAFTGKILIFKHLDIRSDEVFSDFHEVPKNLTFAQGVELLKKQEAILAQNQRGTAPPHQ